MDARETSTEMVGALLSRAERGVTGIGGDTGVAVVVGESCSDGVDRRVLLLGRGGVLVLSVKIPNSDMGSDKRGGREKLLTASVVLQVGIVGDGGIESCGETPLPPVLARLGGGKEGTCSSLCEDGAVAADWERVLLRLGIFREVSSELSLLSL